MQRKEEWKKSHGNLKKSEGHIIGGKTVTTGGTGVGGASGIRLLRSGEGGEKVYTGGGYMKCISSKRRGISEIWTKTLTVSKKTRI